MSVSAAESRLRYIHERRNDDSVWKLPGCGQRCQSVFAKIDGNPYPERIVQHDPDHHEAYGVNVVAVAPSSGLSGVVRTGALSIDGATCEVQVDGVPVHLTPTEFSLLSLLASRMGAVVSQEDILRLVWGREYTLDCLSGHMLRINVTRLRKKLGAARGLLETVTGIGYLLRQESPPVSAADILRDPVRRAAETLDWIEARQGPLAADGYARIEMTVADVRALARLLAVEPNDVHD